MSYQDIKKKLDSADVDIYHDKEAGVEYMVYVSPWRYENILWSTLLTCHGNSYDDIHWVSYDSVESIKQKVDFANENG